MTDPVVLDWSRVCALSGAGCVAWVSAVLVPAAARLLRVPVIGSRDEPEPGLERLVVIGGGTLIDRAKLWRRERSPATWLCAVPSIWGSGADASPVAVRTEGGRRVPIMAPDLVPDARSVWVELAARVPHDVGRWGYGDVWSHAVEAFMSPLATRMIRDEIASFVLERLLPQAFEPDSTWFDLAAEACALQARSGVGLVHGIAHELEEAGSDFGHARLCSTYLWPVLRFNARINSSAGDLASSHGLNLSTIEECCRALFDESDYRSRLPLLTARWMEVLRNPLTRINSSIVRPASLAFFREFMQ